MKKISFLLLFAAISFTSVLKSQNWEWAKNIENGSSQYVSEMLNDSSGNIYISIYSTSAGLYEGFLIDSGIFIAKFNPQGNIIWVKNIPGRFRMKFDHKNCLNITGTYYNDFSMDSYFIPCNGESDIYLIKINASGSVTTIQTYGGGGKEECNSMSFDSNGNIYLTGSFSDSFSFNTINLNDSNNWSNFFIVSFDSLLNVRWAKAGDWNQA